MGKAKQGTSCVGDISEDSVFYVITDGCYLLYLNAARKSVYNKKSNKKDVIHY